MTREKTPVLVYGTDWCGLTHAFRERLEVGGVRYTYHDIETDLEAEEAVKTMNGGKRKFPMVVVGETVMKNPPLPELEAALERYGLLDGQ